MEDENDISERFRKKYLGIVHDKALRLEDLINEFFRLDPSRSSETGNSGLGIAIAKSIVTAHGGTITAKSQDDIIEMSVKLPI
jgi:two-component system sensor histidine kinase VanS